ncbi:MAG: hypothetical protein COB02_15905 [Candidatus Cloacimonadota bacterium]|nr:MAG: hypothetical protein COB02_15905 [Candidatus Cloacimonadota bacterium]
MWSLETIIEKDKTFQEESAISHEEFLSHLLVSILNGLFPKKSITEDYHIYIPLFLLCGLIWPLIMLLVTFLSIKIAFGYFIK